MHRLWEGSQNQVLELDCVIRQRIHKVEVEVTQELRVIFQDHQYNIHRCCVEAPHGRRGLLAWNKIGLDKSEALDK